MRSQLLLPFSAAGLLLASGCGDDATSTDPTTDADSSSSSESGGATEEPGTTVTPTTSDASTSSTTTGGTTTPGDDSTSSGETADPTTAGSSSDTDEPINNCASNPELCGAGTVCMDGMCKPDCSGDPAACGAGTVCGPELVCVVDCRTNLLDVCAGEGLCNRGTGVCEAVASYDCNAAPGLCWEDQTCGSDGFCRAAAVDFELAYDVQHYDLRLDLLTAEQAFAAEVAISLVATQDATAQVVLDVGAETLVDGEPWQPYAVTGVVDGDGQALEFVQDGPAGSLTVTLASPLAQGDAAVLRVGYAGSFNAISDDSDPLFYTGVMRRDGKNGDPYVMTFGWPVYARRWLPSQDHPRDIATFSVDVGIDNDYVVLGNGAPVRSGEVDGLQRTAFVLQQPVPTYAMHVIASEFETVRLGVVDGVPVDAVVHAAEVPLVHDLWGVAVGALALFNDRLGAYPFSRYAMISVPSAFGGMEHATIVSMADAGVVPNGQGTHRTAIHELSHHWFGDNNHQAEWPAFWLNESLASFMEMEGLRVLGGATLYRERLDTVRKAVFAAPGNYNADALHYATAQDFPGQVTTASFYAPYAKGPWIWHMLRVRLGTDAFNAAVRDLYELHRFGSYSTESALTVLTDSSGEDLAQFFAEWVDTPGWPKLKVTYMYDAAQQEIDVTVQQVQDVALYGTYTLEGALDLDLAFDDGDPMTPTCNVAVAFATGEVEVGATVACPAAPTSFAIPSLADVFAELVP